MRTRGSTVAVHQSDELKFILDSAKGGSTRRKIKTTKLPTSLEEMKALRRDDRPEDPSDEEKS
jgi:hypothetical protein